MINTLGERISKFTFDINKFVNTPKCKGEWELNEARCLLTAFFQSFGLRTNKGSVYINIQDRSESICFAFEQLVNYLRIAVNEKCFLSKDFNYDEQTHSDLCKNPGCIIISNYDNDNPEIALDIIWRVIEKLPNKVGFGIKEDVKYPELACKIGDTVNI